MNDIIKLSFDEYGEPYNYNGVNGILSKIPKILGIARLIDVNVDSVIQNTAFIKYSLTATYSLQGYDMSAFFVSLKKPEETEVERKVQSTYNLTDRRDIDLDGDL